MAGVSMSGEIHGLMVALTHGPSGTVVRTVPPTDNGGDGSSFSPTDLVGAALAACALSTMALKAPGEGLAWGDAKATVVKHMVGPPRRIGKLELVFDMPRDIPAAQRARLEEIAHTCPVALTLSADVEVPMTFRYP